MDKHEFNIKVDQIKKMVSKGDFETAMKIADTIDWRRVRNANLLSMISSVYEKNAEYQEAKDILLIAFERAPIGKRLLYKLTQLALKEGDIEEAESYYREFCDLAGDDSRQDILRYLILKAKGAPIEQLIHSLESYTSLELDEKWLYELAELYHQAGNADECVKTCDKIMLMFGLGQYVDKAMELKLQYAPLTKYQMDLVENRDKYEEKLRQVEQNGVNAVVSQEAPVSREEEEMAAAARRGQVAAMEAKAAPQPVVSAYTETVPPVYAEPVQPAVSGGYADEPVQAPVSDGYPGAVQQPAADYRRSDEHTREEEMVSNIAASFAAAAAETQGVPVSPEERLEVSMKEAEVEASLAEEMSKISIDSYSEEPVREKTRVLQNVKDLKKAGEQPEKTKVLDEIRHIQAVKPTEEPVRTEETAKEKEVFWNHFMVEARTAEAGLEIAIQALKKAHQMLEYKHPVAKISGEKLNQRGILASAPKLAGKDLIVENAGDLSDAMLEELDKFLEQDKAQMLLILVDTPRQMEGIRRINPSLAAKFHVITSAKDAEKVLLHAVELRKNSTVKTLGDRIRERKNALENRPVRQPAEPSPAETQPSAVRQPVQTKETVSVRQPVQTKDTDPVRPSVQTRETAPVLVRAKEEDPVRQPEPQRESVSASGDTKVFSRVETAASSNIVPMRNKQTALPDERELTEQGKNGADEADDGRIMDIDEFAQYCCHYASQIDCNISGKSMLALYERIEIMEEDGIDLTKTAAEDLIEEAADRAEKPSLGKRIAGLFSSKYDKEGLLILKEEHFI